MNYIWIKSFLNRIRINFLSESHLSLPGFGFHDIFFPKPDRIFFDPDPSYLSLTGSYPSIGGKIGHLVSVALSFLSMIMRIYIAEYIFIVCILYRLRSIDTPLVSLQLNLIFFLIMGYAYFFKLSVQEVVSVSKDLI